MLALGSIAYFCLLIINGIAILSHDRFLVPLGLHAGAAHSTQAYGGAGGAYSNGFESYGGGPHSAMGGGSDGPGIKQRAVTLLDAVRTLMRIPLIPINILVIVYEILLG